MMVRLVVLVRIVVNLSCDESILVVLAVVLPRCLVVSVSRSLVVVVVVGWLVGRCGSLRGSKMNLLLFFL